ncbi:DUF3806 domain-containing protein [Cellulomonas massiliensis]|uniref:DUF3806 domain-containing protein n=1 Tax=Cellulomonas massiliensis TaxID=1465811 RepID=UPI0003142B1C|nr:DUF3806 domain-containing protein [Cellulomonas massiliensis]
MTDVLPPTPAPASGPVAAGMRALLPAESAHLDRLREHLRSSGARVDDVHALGSLVDATARRWAAAPAATEALLVALGVGVGDLVLAASTGARWVIRTGSGAPTPALLDAAGLHAVVPLDDLRKRWTHGDTEWLPGYVAAAAAHLGQTPDVPTQRTEATPVVPASDDGADRADRAEPRRSRERRRAPRTPQELPDPPSPAVQDLAIRALDDALGTALTGTDVAPFVLVESLGLRVVRFDGVEPRAAVTQARAWLADSRSARGALAWAARIDERDRLVDDAFAATLDPATVARAVVVEAGEPGRPTLVVAHRFGVAPGAPNPVALGGPVLLGQGAPLMPA